MTSIRTRPARAAALLAVATTLGALVVAAAPAGGVAPVAAPHTMQVNALPNGATPHALNGSVRSVAVVGGTVSMGGDFTQAANPDRTPVARSWILAFDKATGVIRTGWVPLLDGMVFTSIARPADGQSIYVGGALLNINGVRQPKLARISWSATVTPGLQGRLRRHRHHHRPRRRPSLVGGVFKNVQGRALRVAAIDAQTGVVDDRMTIPCRPAPTTAWRRQDLAARALARRPPRPHGGSFTAVGGQPRGQIAKLDPAPDGAPSLSPWSTTRYSPTAPPRHRLVRDISYSPDGSYFVVVTTGARARHQRHPVRRSGPVGGDRTPNAQPTWFEYPTGGDWSTRSRSAVPPSTSAATSAGRTTQRPRLQAARRRRPRGHRPLDPVNGSPAWNPGRDRGRAVWQMLSTPDGL